MPKRVKNSKRAKKSKGGRKTRSKMYGGKLIGSGNNTCVYDPQIACDKHSPPFLENHVSRIVPSDSIEPAVQEQIKVALTKMNPKYLKHFNLATKICKALFKESDLEARKCEVENLGDKIKVGKTDLINMITPKQESDINRSDTKELYKNLETTNAAIKEFLHALVEMNSCSVQVFHTDAHLGNFSWKGDSIVLHDWEKCIVGDAKLLIEINGTTENSWHILGYKPASEQRLYLIDFPCWNQILVALVPTIDKFQGIFPPNHETVHLAHEILFRFWDLFSIIPSLYQVYLVAKMEVPKFIKLIDENVTKYYYDAFHKEFLDTARGGASLEYRTTKMNEITQNIHAIIDSAVADAAEEQAATGAELKVVAQDAFPSPSKK